MGVWMACRHDPVISRMWRHARRVCACSKLAAIPEPVILTATSGKYALNMCEKCTHVVPPVGYEQKGFPFASRS